MVDAPNLVLAFAAGFVSFVSPCCLPLVPGYLAVVAGPPDEASRRRVDPALLGRSLLFVGSFSLVFIVLGLSATWLGALLFDNQVLLNKLAGAAIVIMGVLYFASPFVTAVSREWRPERLVQRAGAGGPVLTGFAFAVAWTPCIGPTLGAVLGLAATRQGTGQAAGLLAIYSAGLAVPFVFSAIAYGSAQRFFGFFRRHRLVVQAVAGAMLVGVGILVFAGQLFWANIAIRHGLDTLGLDFLARGL